VSISTRIIAAIAAFFAACKSSQTSRRNAKASDDWLKQDDFLHATYLDDEDKGTI
jgi:hypothetical protein